VTAITHQFIDVRPGDSLALSGAANVELVHKSGSAARLKVSAAREIRIERVRGAAARGKAVPSVAVSPP
jgi:hypothetical protein